MSAATTITRRRIRAFRADFTEAEFERHKTFFWPIPASWGHPECELLRRLWADGGVGAISSLPVLGRYVHMEATVPLSLEECARLAGCNVSSIRRGAAALKNAGLSALKLGRRHGQTLTLWTPTPALAASMVAGKLDSNSFRFSSALVYSGTWSMLTGVQRAVYIAVATKAHSFTVEKLRDFLDDVVLDGVDRRDIDDAISVAGIGAAAPEPRFRAASVSVAEVSHIAGVSQSAVHEAINGFRWGENGMSADASHLPLATYAAAPGRSNVFFFRDHATRLPLDVVNIGRRSR
jgi:hypothetical protein